MLCIGEQVCLIGILSLEFDRKPGCCNLWALLLHVITPALPAPNEKKPADPQEISRHRIVTHSLVTEVTGELVASTARSGTGWAARSGTGRSCTGVTARSGTRRSTAVRRSTAAAALAAVHLRQAALLQQAAEAVALLLRAAARSTAVSRSRCTARSGWGTAARSSSTSIAARSGTSRSRTGIAARRCTGRSRITARVPVQLEQACVRNA